MGGRKNRELVGKRNPRAQRWGRDFVKQPSHRVVIYKSGTKRCFDQGDRLNAGSRSLSASV